MKTIYNINSLLSSGNAVSVMEIISVTISTLLPIIKKKSSNNKFFKTGNRPANYKRSESKFT